MIERFLKKDARTLEAGTGGGRVLLALRRRGFTDLSGFDYVPELIARAREKEGARGIEYRVMEAGDLAYPDAHFDQVLYLQQILCCIEDDAERRRAVREAYRVVKPGGVALFSFLILEARAHHFVYGMFLKYLRMVRVLSGRKQPLNYQPWLRRAGAPNYAALLDRPPYVYWATVPGALALLRDAGFTVTHLGTSSGLRAGAIGTSEADLRPFRSSDQLYVVCKKITRSSWVEI